MFDDLIPKRGGLFDDLVPEEEPSSPDLMAEYGSEARVGQALDLNRYSRPDRSLLGDIGGQIRGHTESMMGGVRSSIGGTLDAGAERTRQLLGPIDYLSS